jgi:lysophospholipase L1-like esterase
VAACGHPNAQGHRILAEALYAGLRELPPHCRFPVLP